ncbi:right-handed parallel beta-helix repeat-containing protein [Bombilactobacillus bombi]|uniref:right-handed parallel beta-helix repeat-containing protein n=1 Tax=Bombilactobacillus bombi TaxID=1303590 RepID=UPI000E5753B8|nr:right-handed parallel beta-helix repeat-containing protein [Bombilactobacillus bombi]AXX65021.1 right-handed parallel beta-helix repeat-containing protein [Bombilactobacillus bombi]
MKIYVNAKATRDGNGSKKTPYKLINSAAKVAMPGDEIIVFPGIYHENVNPMNSGTRDQRIIYKSVEPLKAVITGAEEANNWKRYQGGVWVTYINNSLFGSYNPYTTYVMGDWYMGSVNKHTGAVYMNDIQFYETSSLNECINAKIYDKSWNPKNSVFKWYTEQNKDTNTTIIYANFQDKDPNKEKVEINVRREAFWPQKTGVNYITVSGFNINKAATTWAPPASYQDGMIGPHWSKGWIIEDCDISHSRCAGISLGKYRDPENDQYFTYKHVKSPTQMERDAVCRGQYHGWLKEKIGHHIIRRCNIHDCEQDGIVGRQGAVFSVIEDNHIHHINNMQELAGAEIAGIKLHAAIDVIIRRNRFDHTTMGLWCDWEAQGTRITQNLFDHNYAPNGTAPRLNGAMTSQDIWIEVSHGPTLIDNNLLLSKNSLKIPTQGLAIVHNLILGSFTLVGEGTDYPGKGPIQPRFTPYHIPHRTEVAGFQTILHGDNRFYNNIFIQKWPATNPSPEENEIVGTAVFDDYPTYEEWYKPFKKIEGKAAQGNDMVELQSAQFEHLPIWAKGNVYFNGAQAWKKETHNIVNNKDKIEVKLIENDTHVLIKTNLYDFLGNFEDGIINTDILGKAFEPEQRFEMPNGDDITFDEDYFGNHRGLSTMPGPFASIENLNNALWNN